MSTSTSTSPSCPSGPRANQVLLIVELLERIGFHLNPPDLLSCVQVSRHWSSVLMPHLWHTIDDRLYSWACILKVYISDTAPRLLRIVKDEQDTNSSIESFSDIEEAKVLKQIALEMWLRRRAETTHWLYRIFQKHGRHVRILRVSWPIIIRVAGMAGHCKQLRVLTVHPVLMRIGPARNKDEDVMRRQQQREDIAWTENYTGAKADWQGFWRTIDDEDEEARLQSSNPSQLSDGDPIWLNWGLTRRFWILVLRNPTIEHLLLGRGLKTLVPFVTPVFVCYALATLPRLKTLSNRFMELDFQTVLEHTSAIPSGGNRNMFYHMDNGCGSNLQLDKNFPHLTTLAIKRSLESSHVLMFLKRLVNLDQLFLGQISWSDRGQPPFADIDDNYEERSHSFTLTGLHLAQSGGLLAEYKPVQAAMAIHLIPRLPFLTELTTEVLIPEVAKALASHCKQLRIFRQGGDDECIGKDYQVKSDVNVVGVLLESCPNLTIIDTIQHRIDATYLAEHPWVCEATLETFRCQIVGLERMTSEDYQVMSILSEQDSTQLLSRDVAEEKYKRSKEQHCRVYERLSRLAHLQTLDIGGDVKGVGFHMFGECGDEPIKDVNGRIHLLDSYPIMDCLDLSLDSGLDQLASLVNLKVFGFEGLDHRIETAELEWFATHWPRLAIMRGLHIDDSETLNKMDTKTTRQRQEMQALRPLVRHESATPTNVLETLLHLEL
ncbi:hypothetical protein BGZ96_010427 [Linnemannia gamsii]|uniref:F-box domain-containing protein n=1 Tax=Linnemannia gamsii TaxID=64522 RepID=A0ABQ7JV14_9FUNG|nr:hypothetical protein BGZ96_010427 [Linnemannia gamsii]